MQPELTRHVGGSEVPAAGVWEILPRWANVALTIRRPFAPSRPGRLRLLRGTVLVADRPARSMASVSLDARSFESGNEAQDRFVRRELLDAHAHPTIDLVVDSLTETGPGRWDATGELRLRGERRRIALTASYGGLYHGGPTALIRVHAVVSAADLGLAVRDRRLRSLLVRRVRCEIDVEAHARFAPDGEPARAHDIDQMVMMRCG